MKPKKKKNSQDLTLQNSRAISKKLKALEERLEKRMNLIEVLVSAHEIFIRKLSKTRALSN